MTPSFGDYKVEEAEENNVAYLLDLAGRGFPLTHKTLKLHVDTLLRARLGEAFPETGVGHNWTDRFATRHADRIVQYWTWCNLLKETLKREKIEEDCLWAADETGFQPGGGTRQRVFGPVKKKIQHQQHDGNRENITVMVTICADGEDIAPTVIYKGQAFSTNWHQDNELQASPAATYNFCTLNANAKTASYTSTTT
ncbi:hypothetical protein BS17DRAFT_880130 [Gyrodon lividus]|nr:hypothetical protein BS17DRAFT_880130 [Gyrodon lividus]